VATWVPDMFLFSHRQAACYISRVPLMASIQKP
jgi:hypothetical protein